jgi:hypothetical protein
MKKQFSRGLFAIAALAAAALACSVGGSGALLEDDFAGSDNGWGTGTDADSSVEYANEALNIVVNKDFYFAWSTPDDGLRMCTWRSPPSTTPLTRRRHLGSSATCR